MSWGQGMVSGGDRSGVFGTGCGFRVGWHTVGWGGLAAIFRGGFARVGWVFIGGGRDGRWGIILWGLGTFLLLPNFLRT